MSQVNTNAIYDASGGQSAQLYGVSMRYGGTNFVNRIINGDMRIDQRNAGASVAFASGVNTYALDRWYVDNATDGAFTIEQVEDAPAGFYQSLKLAVTTADASIGSTQDAVIQQRIEGLNVTDLGFGTASAATVTLSFWVKSSLTGAFGGSLMNSAYSRAYPFSFTISAANTWEQKTVTIAGDTSGTWLYTNGIGMRVSFSMAAGSSYSGTANAWASTLLFQPTGSTNVIGTNGATFYITGVQLEAGSVATPFERRPYGTELQLCSRYYQKSYNDSTTPGTATTVGAKWSGAFGANDLYYQSVAFNQSMRASATVRIFNVNNGNNNQLSEYTINPTTFATNRAIAIKDAGQAGVSIDGAGQLANGRLYAYHFDATAEL